MEIAINLGNSQGFHAVVDQVARLEQAGLDAVWISENSGFDAPSRVGFVAARTERIQIGTNVMPIYTRSPTLMAMTAAGVDFLSGGRFNLGLGIGGIELLEGFFGTTFEGSLGRMREYVEICRAVWAREGPLVHDGRHYQVPLPADRGTGHGRPRTLLEQPVRPRVPVWLASIGERSVTQTAEIADGWLPLYLIPERFDAAWGSAVAAGKAKRDPALGPLQISVGHGHVAIGEGEDVLALRELARPTLAFFLGAIGPRGRNHYNLLFQRYGWETEAKQIEELWLDGKPAEAAAAIPEDMLALTSLIGPRSWVAERLAAFKEAGVTQLQVSPIAPNRFKAAAEHGYNWHADEGAADVIAELKELAD
jgi:F420-dependent oxidoreductase-like protein